MGIMYRRGVGFGRGGAGGGGGSMIPLETPSTTVVSGGVTYTFSTTVDYFLVDGFPCVIDPGGGLTISSRSPAETTTAAKIINTTIKNPQRLATGATTQGWDERMPGTSWSAALKSSFPLAVAAGDIVVGAIGRAGAVASLNTPVSEYCPIFIVSGQKAVGSVLPASIGWTGRGAPAWYSFDAAAKVATLPSLSTSGMTLPTYATILARVARWETAFGRQSNNASSSNADYEQEFTDGYATTSGSVNYGQYVGEVMGAAGLYLLSDAISSAQKEVLLRHMVRIGVECYDPVAGLANPLTDGNGGHFQFRLIPQMFMGWALGQSSRLDSLHTVNPENPLLQPFVMDSGKVADLAPHSSSTKPYVYRQRTVSGVSGLTVTVPYSSASGDPSATNIVQFAGLELVRPSDGKTANIITGGYNAGSIDLVIDVQPTPAFATSDVVYARSIDPIDVGMADWATGVTWSGYNPTSEAIYRDQNKWSEEVFVSQALGVHRSAWDAMRDYVIRASRTNEPNVNRDFLDHDDIVLVTASEKMAKQFWRAHFASVYAGKPQFLSKPYITGTLADGQTVGVNAGTVVGDATITYAYQWYGDNTAIGGATSSTYSISSQTGKKLSCKITATNSAGSTICYTMECGVVQASIVQTMMDFAAGEYIQITTPKIFTAYGGKKMLWVMSFQMLGGTWPTSGNIVELKNDAGNTRGRIYCASGGRIGFALTDGAGNTIVSATSSTSEFALSTNYTVAFEVDTVTQTFRRKKRPDGGAWSDIAGMGGATVTANLVMADCARAFILASGFANQMYIGDIWIDNNLASLPDISNATTQSKLRGMDYKGASGEVITGTQPQWYHSGPVADWRFNKGSGGGLLLGGSTALSDSGVTPS
jgi:hypothetical protein